MAALVAPIALAAAGLTAAVVTAHKPPRGKGVFVRDVIHADTPAEMVRDCKRWGLSWVTIESIWQNADGSTRRHHLSRIPSYAEALNRAGIKVWIWSWPQPGRAMEIARVYQQLARRADLAGLILDPEGPYQARTKGLLGNMEALASLDVSIFELLDVPLGVTTYGAPPSWHPRFPWRAWSRCLFGMPQLYDTHHKWGASHQRATFDGWRRLGFRHLVPIWGASSAHTPREMQIEIEQTPAEYKASAWWDYYWLKLSPSRAKVVTDFEIGRRLQA